MAELGFPRRILWGERAGEAIAGLLNVWGVKRVLIVSDGVIVNLPHVREIIDSLSSSYEVRVFSDVPPEPPVSVAEKASALARDVDAVIAIGGGSVIDVAKAASVLAKRPGLSVSDVAPFNPLGVEFEKPYLIAVPTTSGTGSDASYGIVLVGEGPGGERVKIAVGSFEVVPHASVLDPDLPRSAPERVRVGALVDALSHALESIASTASNPFSEALAEKAAALIFTTAPRALREGEGWDLLHAAATMAGMAFTNSGLGLAHAIAPVSYTHLRAHGRTP
ncbi:MAG: iron-containing alcohol dehydrogenase, partial [Desulfurococcales archaeon]|nr:iron-containing alcohol dehydrogenase [Desulfurococcales archaeon]